MLFTGRMKTVVTVLSEHVLRRRLSVLMVAASHHSGDVTMTMTAETTAMN